MTTNADHEKENEADVSDKEITKKFKCWAVVVIAILIVIYFRLWMGPRLTALVDPLLAVVYPLWLAAAAVVFAACCLWHLRRTASFIRSGALYGATAGALLTALSCSLVMHCVWLFSCTQSSSFEQDPYEYALLTEGLRSLSLGTSFSTVNNLEVKALEDIIILSDRNTISAWHWHVPATRRARSVEEASFIICYEYKEHGVPNSFYGFLGPAYKLDIYDMRNETVQHLTISDSGYHGATNEAGEYYRCKQGTEEEFANVLGIALSRWTFLYPERRLISSLISGTNRTRLFASAVVLPWMVVALASGFLFLYPFSRTSSNQSNKK